MCKKTLSERQYHKYCHTGRVSLACILWTLRAQLRSFSLGIALQAWKCWWNNRTGLDLRTIPLQSWIRLSILFVFFEESMSTTRCEESWNLKLPFLLHFSPTSILISLYQCTQFHRLLQLFDELCNMKKLRRAQSFVSVTHRASTKLRPYKN